MECITFQCIPSLTRGSNPRDERRHDLIYIRWYLMINVSRLDSRALQNFTIFSCVLLRNNSFILRLLTFSNLINSQTTICFGTHSTNFSSIFFISHNSHTTGSSPCSLIEHKGCIYLFTMRKKCAAAKETDKPASKH